MGRLGRRFFDKPAGQLAVDLLGKLLVRSIDGQRLAGVIVEAEAYLGPEDRAAHTFGGRKTARVASMWKQAGTCYVYFTYGMHHCMNVVAGPDGGGSGQAVLIRAVWPVDGMAPIRARRPKARRDRDLCAGPARVCQALGIGKDEDGLDLVTSDGLWLEKPGPRDSDSLTGLGIVACPRVGIDYAGAWRDRPLRFLYQGHPGISRPATDPVLVTLQER